MANSTCANGTQSSPSRLVADVHLKTTDITKDYDIFDWFTLGRGGSGVVYACNSRRSGTTFALKVVLDTPRARNEVHLHWMASVSDYIVKMEEVYKNNWKGKPSLLVVMEYMAGGDLYKRMQKNEDRRFTEQQAITIAKQMADAITHLHGMNLVHCDLKPQNFLFKTNSLDSPLKLTDFGMAQELTREDMLQNTDSTVYYMYYAPEVLRGDLYDKSCDMWTLGCTIYILLCGGDPFQGIEGADVAGGVQPRMSHGELAFPDVPWRHISHAAKDLITKLLNADANERMSLDEMRAHRWLADN